MNIEVAKSNFEHCRVLGEDFNIKISKNKKRLPWLFLLPIYPITSYVINYGFENSLHLLIIAIIFALILVPLIITYQTQEKAIANKNLQQYIEYYNTNLKIFKRRHKLRIIMMARDKLINNTESSAKNYDKLAWGLALKYPSKTVLNAIIDSIDTNNFEALIQSTTIQLDNEFSSNYSTNN